MSSQVPESDDRPLSVQLDLHLDREPVCGRLRCESKPDLAFTGWLGFVEALRQMRAAQSEKGVDER